MTTLYIKDADLPMVEKAKKELGDSLSSIFIDCIRQRIEQIPAPKGETGKITVETRNSSSARTIRKTFEGRWLIDENDKLTAENDENSAIQWDNYVTYRLAQTRKGALVVYACDPNDDDGEATMEVYDSFDDLKTAEDDNAPRYPDNVIAAFADALGEPYDIELDI